ncbi:MAG TPA: putative maltokinase [Candidatus Acidoferrum sp.]|jgi:trehalose synthase-fused probable maltokinase
MADLGAGKKMASTLQTALASQLPEYLLKQRWFGGKARKVASVDVVDTLSIPAGGGNAYIFVVVVHYDDGADEFYAIPLVRSEGAGAEGLKVPIPDGGSMMLADGLKNAAFLTALAELIEKGIAIAGENGELRGVKTTAYSRLASESVATLTPKPVGAEQSNTSIIYGNRLILKFFRRIQEGINPDLEIGQFLTEKTSLKGVPPLAGTLEYQARDGRSMSQGMLQQFVANQGDAWGFTLKSLANYYDEVRKATGTGETAAGRVLTPGKLVDGVPDTAKSSVETYLAAAELLGQRTAEMHLALASDAIDPAFAPEPFTMESQQALEQSVNRLLVRVFSLLRDKVKYLPTEWREKAERLAERESEIAARFNAALREPIRAMRTRIHGDYHLGQVLRTEADFVIIDFEGEPARSIEERRVKRSPLQDVAGMLRSFHYAAFAPLLGEDRVAGDDVARMGVWAEAWNAWVADRYLAKYFATAKDASYLPATQAEIQTVLELHLLEKAIYELGYELNNRPTWVGIPLQGIGKLLSI